MPSTHKAKCFLIAPLGPPESDTRRYSDKVLKFIVRHSLEPEPLGFRVIRADEISEPGTITLQVVREVLRADLVVADLTGNNPNVMYELALRHSVKKPAILIMAAGQKLPFDIMGERTIIFDINDIESVEVARRDLAAQASAIQSGDHRVENPFSLTEEATLRSAARHSLDSRVSEMAQDIAQIKSTLGTALEDLRSHTVPPRVGAASDRSVAEDSRWIKIQVEFPTTKGVSRENVEISPAENLFETMSAIWSLLQDQDAAPHPEAYTYLWDWLLVRRRDGLPLVVRGIMSLVPSHHVFRDGERWWVVPLEKPLLQDAERFGLIKGMGDRW